MLAGMRIEPPPSPPCASGTIPDATAAADPPLDPPGLRVTSHGLCVGPYASGSLVGNNPNSGVFVLPTITKPAALELREEVAVVGGDVAERLQEAVAAVVRLAGHRAVESFTTIGTPRNGPFGSWGAPPRRGRGRTAGG